MKKSIRLTEKQAKNLGVPAGTKVAVKMNEMGWRDQGNNDTSQKTWSIEYDDDEKWLFLHSVAESGEETQIGYWGQISLDDEDFIEMMTDLKGETDEGSMIGTTTTDPTSELTNVFGEMGHNEDLEDDEEDADWEQPEDDDEMGYDVESTVQDQVPEDWNLEDPDDGSDDIF